MKRKKRKKCDILNIDDENHSWELIKTKGWFMDYCFQCRECKTTRSSAN